MAEKGLSGVIISGGNNKSVQISFFSASMRKGDVNRGEGCCQPLHYGFNNHGKFNDIDNYNHFNLYDNKKTITIMLLEISMLSF